MRILLLFLLLTVCCAARTPTQVVQDAFDYDLQHGMGKTLRDRSYCFTPGFLNLFQKALAIPAAGSAPFVDMDYFRNGQDGGQMVKAYQSEIHGPEAIVFVKIWQGAYRGAPAQKMPAQATTRVFLTDLGQGYQIWDIVHLGGPGHRVSAREHFKLLLAGKNPT